MAYPTEVNAVQTAPTTGALGSTSPTHSALHDQAKAALLSIRDRIDSGTSLVINVNATPDVKQYSDGAVTGTAFTSASNPFVSGDVGKRIIISGAGTGGTVHHATTISAYVSAGAVTLTTSAPTSVSGKVFRFGTDTQAAIQSAVDAANTAGGGVVQLGAGKWGVASLVNHKHNVIIRGAGRDVTTVYSMGASHRIFEGTTTPVSGSFSGVEHICLWGTADLTTSQGSDTDRLSVQSAERIWWRNVHGIWSRQMSLTCGVGAGIISAYAEDCLVEKGLRDGINTTGASSFTAIGNEISECSDDGIAFHISSGLASGTVISPQAVIIGNRFSKTGGIKCLGATNCVITGNSGRFMLGYGVFIDVDTSSHEGEKDSLAINVSDNSFMDIINLQTLGSGQDVAYGIYVGTSQPVVGTPSGLTLPGNGTTSSKAQSNDAWDATRTPATGGYGIIVANNTCMQALESTTNTTFSAFGFGNLWYNTGSQNPTYYGAIARTASNTHGAGGYSTKGIKMVAGALRDSLVVGNKVYGFSIGFDNEWMETYGTRCHWKNNEIVRCIEGVRFVQNPFATDSSQTFGEYIWDGNYFDLDPIFEAGERTASSGQPTGTWTIASSGSTARAFSSANMKGLHIWRNTFKNVAQITARSNEVIDFRENYLILDPVTASPSYGGVNVTDAELFASQVISTVCDPRLATYDQMRSDSIPDPRSAMPSAGVWAKGMFVRNTAPAIAGAMTLTGWLRLTSGSGNTLNTDWAAIYAPTSAAQSINAQTGTTFTPTLADIDGLVTQSNAGAITTTLPQDSDLAFPVGRRIDFVQIGAGQVTFVAGTGATVNGYPGLKIGGQWGVASAYKRAANTWVVAGALSA